MEHDIALLTPTPVACVSAAHAWRTALFSSAAMERGVIHVSDPDWRLVPNMLNWVHVWTPDTPVTHGNIWFLRIWMYRCRFIAASTMTSSLLPPWWIAPHIMTDGPRFPSLGWTQALISLSPCLRRTWTRPSLWYREDWDSSLKIQCLHYLKSHTLCLLPHLRRCRLCSKVILGHLAGRRD